MRFFHYRKSTEEKIKEATISLLAERGYRDLTMRDIAKKAGAAVGQLTYYYKKKENLLLEVVDELLESFTDELKEKVKKSDDKLNAIFEFHENLYKDDKEMVKIFLNFTTESLWDDRLKERYKSFVGNITDIVKKTYVDAGNSEDIANSKANFFISSLYGSMAQSLINNDNKISDGMKSYILKV